MERLDQNNFLAIELIEYLGNDKPAQEQIDIVEYLISHALENLPAQSYRHSISAKKLFIK